MKTLSLLNLSNKELGKRSGVYLITCKKHSYIGSSKNLYHRLREHRYRLINQTHSNDFMQKAFNKYGIEEFHYSVVEFCDPLIRVDRETFYINSIQPDFNLQLDPTLKTLSEYSKQKLSKSIKNGRSEGKYKTKYDYCEVEQYDYFGNFVCKHANKEVAAKALSVTKKTIQNLAGGYKKGLARKGVRLRYSNSSVPPMKFKIDPNYLGKHFDFYCNDEFAFNSVKNVWSFLASKIEAGETELTIEIKLKDPTRSP